MYHNDPWDRALLKEKIDPEIQTKITESIDMSPLNPNTNESDSSEKLALIRKKELYNKYMGEADATATFQKGLSDEVRRNIVDINVILKLSEHNFSSEAYRLIMNKLETVDLETAEMIFK